MDNDKENLLVELNYSTKNGQWISYVIQPNSTCYDKGKMVLISDPFLAT